MVPIGFANSLANMCGYTIHEVGDRVNLYSQLCVGTYVHQARQELANDAVEEGCHYVLWLDSDHTFPKDSLIRLLAHDKPIVGINYAARKIPTRYVGVKRTRFEHGDDAALCRTGPEDTGLEEVEALGFGMLLMKAAVLDSLPKNKPWFWFKYDEETGKPLMGEDIWFCEMARKAGWQIHVDHDLSKECTHEGVLGYRLQHVWAQEEEHGDVDYDVQQSADGDSELAESDGSDE
jgi:hypothetical protein